MFSFAAFLCPIITAGFQEPLDWETGLDEEMYNLQSEPTYYNSLVAGFCSYSASSHPAILSHHVPFMNIHITSVAAPLDGQLVVRDQKPDPSGWSKRQRSCKLPGRRALENIHISKKDLITETKYSSRIPVGHILKTTQLSILVIPCQLSLVAKG